MTATAKIRTIVQQMREAQRAISRACETREDGWRQEVVRRRRELAERIGKIAELTGGERDRASATAMAFRSSLSALRSALAEHQASWPAVSLDPAAPTYRSSVERVRTAFDALEHALRTLDPPRPAHIDGVPTA